MTKMDTSNFDSAVINLCLAMNKLPGIETLESCCGHGKSPFHIWFTMDTTQVGSVVMSRCMSGRYYNYAPGELISDPEWRVYLADTDYKAQFLLKGKPMKEDGILHLPAEKLTNNLQGHIDENFKLANLLMKEGT